MLVPYRLEADAIADLTDGRGGPADPQIAAAMAAAWKRIALLDGQVPPGWAIAHELIAAGAQGARVPSAQNKGGSNLVLWHWRDDDEAAARTGYEAGNGARPTVLDPDRALA